MIRYNKHGVHMHTDQHSLLDFICFLADERWHLALWKHLHWMALWIGSDTLDVCLI